MGHPGNGVSGASEPHSPAFPALADHGRQIRHDAEALVASVRDAADDLQRCLTAQVERRPFSTLGVVAGVGYLLGGGLGSRLTIVLLGAAARVATTLVARELGSRSSYRVAPHRSRAGVPEDVSGDEEETS